MSLFSKVTKQVPASFLVGLALGIAGTGIAAGVGGSSIFPDVKQGTYYDQAIGEMYRAGIITGYANGKFGPDDNVTRGQVAVMMQRLRVELGLAEDEGASHSSRSTDDDDDDDEASSSSRSSSSSSSTQTATPQGQVRFTLAAYSVDEDDGNITISVVRTNGNQGAITVQYETQDDTAKAGEDYIKTTGTLNFINQGTSATFQIPITNDSNSDASEKFKVVLKSPTGGATLGTPTTAEITINDDESGGGTSSTAGGGTSSNPSGVLGFGALDYSVSENGGTINITVNRAQGTQGTVTVNYATTDGTAKSGTEYSGTNGTLSFAAGETAKTFAVTINDDSDIDGNKAFTVKLTNPTNLALLGTATATVTIADNEAGTFGSGSLRFSKLEFEGLETDGKAVVTVLRQSGTKGTVSVQYATSNGTATAGQDYTATSGTMTFQPGEASKTFTIPLTKDTVSDTEETLTIILSAPTGGAVLASPSTSTVRLFD